MQPAVPLLLTGRDNDIRAGFDLMCEQLGIHCRLCAEVDDMALLRLLDLDSDGVALLPAVVVQSELRSGRADERTSGRAAVSSSTPSCLTRMGNVTPSR